MSDHVKLLVPDHVAAGMLSIGRSTFWREVKAGNLPPPMKIGGLTRWRVTHLQRWVEKPASAGNENAHQPTQSNEGRNDVLRRLDTIAWALLTMAGHAPPNLTRDQMCERLGVTSNTIANRLRRGEMPKPGPDGRWLLEEVMKWERGG